MLIEAYITLKSAPFLVIWGGRCDGHPHITCQEPIAVEALQILEEAYTGDPIGLPGYPPNFKEALSDPIGFMALCYMLSERIPHFSVIGDNA